MKNSLFLVGWQIHSVVKNENIGTQENVQDHWLLAASYIWHVSISWYLCFNLKLYWGRNALENNPRKKVTPSITWKYHMHYDPSKFVSENKIPLFFLDQKPVVFCWSVLITIYGTCHFVDPNKCLELVQFSNFIFQLLWKFSLPILQTFKLDLLSKICTPHNLYHNPDNLINYNYFHVCACFVLFEIHVLIWGICVILIYWYIIIIYIQSL